MYVDGMDNDTSLSPINIEDEEIMHIIKILGSPFHEYVVFDFFIIIFLLLVSMCVNGVKIYLII